MQDILECLDIKIEGYEERVYTKEIGKQKRINVFIARCISIGLLKLTDGVQNM